MACIEAVAFTGSLRGMTRRQQNVLWRIMGALMPSMAYHGGAIGADDEFDQLCCDLGINRTIYPSTVTDKRVRDSVFKQRRARDIYNQQGKGCPSNVIIHLASPPLERNRVVVDIAGALIACPKTPMETLRSGTWATIRYAKSKGLNNIWVIQP